MSSMHQFGGDWTEKKLVRLEKGLSAYMQIFSSNLQARKYTTYYIDAFAGSGSRVAVETDVSASYGLFDDDDAQDIVRINRGSVRVALEVSPPFDHYLFIDQNPQFTEDLAQLREEFSSRHHTIEVVQGDANQVLQDWCRQMDRRRTRAVVFLDPYGMSVNWKTVSAIGGTKAIDLWVLLPVGQAINRLLTRKKIPEGAWANRLTAFFGTDQWIEAFYRPSLQPSLFDEAADEVGVEKVATFDSIVQFFVERLQTVFPGVARNHLVLRNSKNIPLFVLCFAAANETAIEIANYILRG